MPTKPAPDYVKKQLADTKLAVESAALTMQILVNELPGFSRAFARAKVAVAKAERKLNVLDPGGHDYFGTKLANDEMLAVFGAVAVVGLKHEDMAAVGLMLDMSVEKVEGLLLRAGLLFNPDTYKEKK